MRWVTFELDGTDRVGVLDGEEVRALAPGVRLVDLFGRSPEEFAAAGERALAEPADVLALSGVRLRAPVPDPPAMRDFLAFEEHLRNARKKLGGEVDPDWYELPVFYFTNPAAVHDPDAEVAVPPGCRAFDYELEMAAVVGWPASDVHPDDAGRLIAGYTLFNDFSARDLQMREMRQTLGPAKGKDSATTLGPVLVTPDELAPHRAGRGFALRATASVNGRTYSDSGFGAIHWSFEEMIAYAARGTRVRPGDVIGSGTCGRGCILELQALHGEEKYPWLAPGDELVLEVEQIGRLANRIVAGPEPHPTRTAG